MSRFSPYLELKRTNVDYLKEAPAHWSEMQLCRAVSWNDEVVQEGLDDEEKIRYVDISSVSHMEGITQATEMKFADAPSRARRKAKEGDVVVSTVRTYLKAVARVTHDYRDCVFSTGFAVIRARPTAVHSDYLEWLMLNELLIQSIEAHSEGLSYPAINASALVKLKTVFPPINEQAQISSFLNRETTRIDTLIAKKTRFIELLKEKRLAVITKAVTKGLDDSVAMKDSRVKWLGLVPNHWVVAQLSRVTQSRCDGPFGSGLKSHHYTSDGVRVVRLQNIGFAEFKNDNAAFVSYEHWEETLGRGHAVTPGDLLIAGLGDDNNPLGRACTAPEEIGDALVKADCYRFRLDPQKAFSKFFAFLLSATSKAECGFMATGATRDRLNLGLASSRVVAFPPSVEEQKEIVAYIESKVRQINLLLSRTERSIELLKEHRAALITAAVTGKIDVREAA